MIQLVGAGLAWSTVTYGMLGRRGESIATMVYGEQDRLDHGMFVGWAVR